MDKFNYRRVIGANILAFIVLWVLIGVLSDRVYRKVEHPVYPVVSTSSILGNSTSTTVTIRTTSIIAEIASTTAERDRGLSGRASLAPGHGMLFVFQTPDRYAFWMKDMYFALDFIWIGADGRIVDLTEAVLPSSYPDTFTPRAPVLMVLEVPAGIVQNGNFHIGDPVVLTPFGKP